MTSAAVLLRTTTIANFILHRIDYDHNPLSMYGHSGQVGAMGDDGRLKPTWGGLAVSGRLAHPQLMTAELIRGQEWELSLNQAILRANLHFGPEPFVAAFDTFYADEAEIRNNDNPPVKGKPANQQMLATFLQPIHLVVEAGTDTLHSFEMEERRIEPGGILHLELARRHHRPCGFGTANSTMDDQTSLERRTGWLRRTPGTPSRPGPKFRSSKSHSR
jgi:hypothetical protein